MYFEQFVKDAVLNGASDIHLATGNYPAVRINGKVIFYKENGILTDRVVKECIKNVFSPVDNDVFLKCGDADGAVSIDDCGRFRLNAFKQRCGSTLVMRIINADIPELRHLNLPQAMEKILKLKEGLVLITGPTGSGKSTTLAALINEINKHTEQHIITIEDPVEYLHTPINCIINQREVGEDSLTYSAALRAALREDPDVILMGEIRDYESMSIALSAAETGHLVFSTLHTESAAKSVDRLIDMYPVDRQQQALGQLSTTLKAVVSQRLLPRADIKGRIGAFEIMFVNSAIANLIRENKISQMEQIIQLNKSAGMIIHNESVQNLLDQGFITKETADKYSYEITKTDDSASKRPF